MRYLSQIRGVYYFRIRVPSDLQKFFPAPEIKKSLRTSNSREAGRLCKPLLYNTERIFILIRSSILTTEEIKRIVYQYYTEVLKNTEIWTALGRTAPMTEGLQPKMITAYASVIDELKKDLVLNLLATKEEAADLLIKERGLQIPKGSDDYKILCRELIKAEISYFQKEQQRIKGEYPDEYNFAAPAAFADTHSALLPEAQKKLSELISEYIKDKELTKAWRSRTKDENERMYKLFSDIVGIVAGNENPPIRSITREIMQNYVKMLKQLPSNMKRKPEYRNMTISEAIEHANNIDAPRLDTRTCNKNIEQISAVFRWGVAQGYLDKNPAESLTEKESRREHEERDVYSKTDLEKLFTSPIYSAKIPLKQPERFFVPLIALFSGMRLEEICQLHIDDVKEIEGVWCFDVNDKGEKNLKNTSSARIVPIHPFLLQAGLMEYVKCRRDSGEIRLWGLIKGRNGYGHYLGKWYSGYLRKYVTKNPKIVFHSFRHTFTDNLKQQGANESVISELVGHSHGSITMDRYGKRYKPAVLLEAIQKLDYGLDLSGLKFPSKER